MATTLKPIEIEMLPDGRMNTKNSAKYLGLSEKTLAMMRSRGTGPRFVKRGRVFYFQSDLDAWVLEGRVVSSSQSRIMGG